MVQDMKSPLIFDIKRYAINDGPGIRVTVFFKGCPLSCKWCHNPESQSPGVQKMFTASKCIGCRACVEVCRFDACKLTSKGVVTDVSLCTLCGDCAKVCPATATEMIGKYMTVEEIMEIIRKETVIMDKSGGGVTFSGGEPLMFPRFLNRLLHICGDENIHRCVDTSGYAKQDVLLETAKRTDLFLYDLKLMDSEKHKLFTGVDNKLILDNLEMLSATDADINIRIPLVYSVNDDEENLVKTAKFIAGLKGKPKKVNILPYHNIAEKKYEKLGTVYNKGTMDEPPEESMKLATEIFRSYNINVVTGG